MSQFVWTKSRFNQSGVTDIRVTNNLTPESDCPLNFTQGQTIEKLNLFYLDRPGKKENIFGTCPKLPSLFKFGLFFLNRCSAFNYDPIPKLVTEY